MLHFAEPQQGPQRCYEGNCQSARARSACWSIVAQILLTEASFADTVHHFVDQTFAPEVRRVVVATDAGRHVRRWNQEKYVHCSAQCWIWSLRMINRNIRT